MEIRAAEISAILKQQIAGFGSEGEQVGPQSWPAGFRGESGDVVVGLVELCDGRGPTSCSAAT